MQLTQTLLHHTLSLKEKVPRQDASAPDVVLTHFGQLHGPASRLLANL